MIEQTIRIDKKDLIKTVAANIEESARKASDRHTRSSTVKEDLEAYCAIAVDLGIFPNLDVIDKNGKIVQIPCLIIQTNPTRKRGIILLEDGRLNTFKMKSSPTALGSPQESTFSELNHRLYRKHGKNSLSLLLTRFRNFS